MSNESVALDNVQAKSLIDIYKRQILSKLDSEVLLKFSGELQSDLVSELSTLFASRKKEAQTKLFNSISRKERCCSSLRILSSAFPDDNNLQCRLSLSNLAVGDQTLYLRLLSNYSDLKEYLEMDQVLKQMKGLRPLSAWSPLVGIVEETLRSSGDETAVKALLKDLPYVNESWYWDFLSCCDGPTNATVRSRIHDNFRENYAQYKQVEDERVAETQTIRKGYCVAPGARTSSSAEPKRTRRDNLDTGNAWLIDYRDANVQVDQLDIREYQLELSEHAFAGHNTIISAPTGSGKTFVAAEILRRHFEAGRRDRRWRRAAFFVPTVPLVAQQSAVFRRFLSDRCIVGGLSGGETFAPKAETALGCHIVVMTPQIMVNMLKSNMEKERLYLSDFTMFIFDECHHTAENHAYNVVMDLFNEERQREKFDTAVADDVQPRQLQVIGLTASLGVGSGNSVDTATDHILTMAANMCATRLSMVRRCLRNLYENVNVPVDDLLQVSSNHHRDPFFIVLNQIMEMIEANIKPILEYWCERKQLKENEDLAIPTVRYSEKYIMWLSRLLKKRVPKLRDNSKSEVLANLMHLKVYCNTLELALHLPNSHAFEYVKENMEFFRSRVAQPYDEFLLSKFDEREEMLTQACADNNMTQPTKEIVAKLRQLLEEEYAKQPESRTIVFVQTRRMTLELMKHLNQMPVPVLGPRVGYLTSVNQSTEASGQSGDEQRRELRNFDKGDIRVLIATTVAEEGLDVAKCNLIIKYNHVTNEIAMVQRRGRGRAQGSRSVLIAQDGRIAERELENMRKESLMKHTLNRIASLGDVWFEQEVKAKLEKVMQERSILKSQKQVQRLRFKDKQCQLLCKQCDAFVCESDSMRVVQQSHFVSVDPSLWQRGFVEPHRHPKSWHLLTLAGKMSCRECRHEWGIILKYHGCFLPGLKSEAVIVSERDEETGELQRHQLKQWKRCQDLHFTVYPIVDEDMETMNAGLERGEAEKLDEIVEQSEAEQLRREEGKLRLDANVKNELDLADEARRTLMDDDD